MGELANRTTQISAIIHLKGIVQGVGFRPEAVRLARSFGLTGVVRNNVEGLHIEVAGPESQIAAFYAALLATPPPLAEIWQASLKPGPAKRYRGFRILPSQTASRTEALVPPDVATCPSCRQEILDPENRRHRYPFTTCTLCGPRFSVARHLPYDRSATTLSSFSLCAACKEEYHQPENRRFHAESTACPNCGPRLRLTDARGFPLPGDPISQTAEFLERGLIVALKSIGGFNLACRADDEAVVAELRRRKHRPQKPFAIMMRDIETVRRHCFCSDREAALLQSPEAPIVLLRRRPGSPLAASVAPGLATLGVFLPYNPLHILLFAEGPATLVMTSGNRSGEPIAGENEEALTALGQIADAFLLHDRPIHNRVDDSVVQLVGEKVQFLRRARGYVPRGIPLSEAGSAPSLLAVGAQHRNAFALTRGDRVYLSQHLGDMDSPAAKRHFEETLARWKKLLGVEPAIAVHDAHPNHTLTRWAEELPVAHRFAAFHHHAHLAACLAEHGFRGRAVGLILDGTGYGADGRIWGMEILVGDASTFRRSGHLQWVPLLGGERAIREPALMLAAHIREGLGPEEAMRHLPGMAGELSLLFQAADSDLFPLVSSAGRLFDAVAFLLGFAEKNTYDGEAAIRLSEAVIPTENGRYPFPFRDGVFHPAELFRALLDDLDRGVDRSVLAARFQNSVAHSLVEAAARTAEAEGLDTVALSGGVWHNRHLLNRVEEGLGARGLRVLVHRLVPPGDGGLALGQVAIGLERWKDHVSGGTGKDR